MDFRELRYILRRHAVLAAAAFLVCVLAGGYASFGTAKTYRTAALLTVRPSVSNNAQASMQQMTFAAPALELRLESQAMRDSVADSVEANYRSVRVAIDAALDSSVLRITGTGSSAAATQAWVNAVANGAVATNDPASSPFTLALLDPAPLRRAPISPKVKPIMVGSVTLGLMASVFAALVAHRVRESSSTPLVIRDVTGTPLLGEVPRIRDLERGRVTLVDLLEDDASAELITAFERIRTNLVLRLQQTGALSIAVVSLDEGDGRSTVATGIGYALAAVGRDVVLVEADLRSPCLPEMLDVVPGRGLGGMAMLGGERPQVQVTAHHNLRLVAAGVPVGRAADVVTSTLPQVIGSLAEPGRLLLIDTPGLRSAPEGALAAGLAGAAVLVIGPGKTDLMSLSASMARLEEAGTQVLGVVINRAPLRRFRSVADEGPPRLRVENGSARQNGRAGVPPASRQVAYAIEDAG